MTYMVCAVRVPVSSLDALVAASALVTPDHVMSFATHVTDQTSTPTWETPTTHMYFHGDTITLETVSRWQTVKAGAMPDGYVHDEMAEMSEQDVLDAFATADLWTAQATNDAPAWAVGNLATCVPPAYLIPPPSID